MLQCLWLATPTAPQQIVTFAFEQFLPLSFSLSHFSLFLSLSLHATIFWAMKICINSRHWVKRKNISMHISQIANVAPHENILQGVANLPPSPLHSLQTKLGNSFIEFDWLKGIMYASFWPKFFLLLNFFSDNARQLLNCQSVWFILSTGRRQC